MTAIRKTTGIALAAAAAAMFLAGSIGSAPVMAEGTVKCAGINSCKGTSACKTASNPGGPGQNSCKGQGMSMTNTTDECTKAGGTVLKS